jgi:SAM-dependent methyltransferase
LSQDHLGPTIDSVNSIEIIECVNCGFKHALLLENLSDSYTWHYYNSEKPNYILDNESDSRWWDLTYGERISVIDSLAGTQVHNWIDIGTGPGLFLDALKSRKRNSTGIEPSIEASKHAISKGHNVINAFFDKLLAKQVGEFDAGHLSEVLEHVPNPLEFLEDVGKVIKSGGYLCIVVPNDYNPIQKVFTSVTGQGKYWLAPPFHLNYFDKASLEGLIRKAGFEVVHSTVMFPIDFFLLMGDLYVGDSEVGKASHERRKNFEFSFQSAGAMDIMRNLYDALGSVGMGRELVCFAKKI